MAAAGAAASRERERWLLRVLLSSDRLWKLAVARVLDRCSWNRGNVGSPSQYQGFCAILFFDKYTYFESF